MKNLTDSNFEAELNKPGYLLVDFWAVWCPPCKAMTPIFEQVSKEYPDVEFVKVNATENPELSTKYRIDKIPAFILFKDGQPVHRDGGLKNAVEFSSWVKEGMSK
jgi:thioredoxin 1